jgi:hypothetical protein
MTTVSKIGLLRITLVLVMCTYETHAQVKQPREVLEAYAVCNKFQEIMGKDLNFSDAFEATFAHDLKRRREIALRDAEFGSGDLSSVDSATLISAYKNQMQLFYLMLPLAGPSDYEEERLFFPPTIKEIFKRNRPETAKDFPAFAVQLEKDAVTFRSHLNDLSARNPRVADRVSRFKHDALTGKLVPPKTRRVEPDHGGSSGRAVWDGEAFYQLEGYTVVREEKQMKIVSIRFFTRLF